jgi:hypothetical protein
MYLATRMAIKLDIDAVMTNFAKGIFKIKSDMFVTSVTGSEAGTRATLEAWGRTDDHGR